MRESRRIERNLWHGIWRKQSQRLRRSRYGRSSRIKREERRGRRNLGIFGILDLNIVQHPQTLLLREPGRYEFLHRRHHHAFHQIMQGATDKPKRTERFHVGRHVFNHTLTNEIVRDVFELEFSW